MGPGQPAYTARYAADQRHCAKGLEFDHVAIQDGNWHTAGKGEDTDAPRRLYYVAMTRARRTLTLAKTGESIHSSEYFAVTLQFWFGRSRTGFLPPLWKWDRHTTGLRVMTDRTPWGLAAVDGIEVGRLAQGFKAPAGTGEVSATTLAIACWDRTKSEGSYRDRLKSERWEVVVPEIVVGISDR